MNSDLQNKDAALRFRISEIQAKFEQFLSSEERALLSINLRELKNELASLAEIWNKHPCPYGLVEFTQEGTANVILPKSATAADFLHAFGHTLMRHLPSDKLSACKTYLNTTNSDSYADIEERFACACERFYWDDDPSDRNPGRESIRKALRKVYRTTTGTRIDVTVSPTLRDMFRLWSHETPPNYFADADIPPNVQQASSASIDLSRTNPIPTPPPHNRMAFTIPWQLLCACTLAVVVGFFKLPYGYYIVVRTTICIAAAYGFSLALQQRSDRWMWVYGVASVLYNPVFPVRLGSKELWVILNVLALLVFWGAFWRSQASRKVTQNERNR